MVDKITIFELRMDDPKFGTNDAVEDTVAEDIVSERSGPNVGRLVVASLFVSVAATVLARRLFGGEDIEEIEIDDVSEEPIEVEQ